MCGSESLRHLWLVQRRPDSLPALYMPSLPSHCLLGLRFAMVFSALRHVSACTTVNIGLRCLMCRANWQEKANEGFQSSAGKRPYQHYCAAATAAENACHDAS